MVPDGRLDDALLDRPRLDDARLGAMPGQLRALADAPAEPSRRTIRDLPGGLRLAECRRPVGVIGANFEARPNVAVDAGVLRTGSAAIRSAIALADEVIAPALGQAGLDPAMIQLVRLPGQDSARALVSQPGLMSVPETGINIDAVPGPRGPVTFRDLYLRQFVVTPL